MSRLTRLKRWICTWETGSHPWSLERDCCDRCGITGNEFYAAKT